MQLLLRLLKLMLLAFVVLCHLIVASLIHFLTTNPVLRRKRFVHNTKFFTGIALGIFGFKPQYKNLPDPNKQFLFIGNHLGYWDIFLIASRMPTLFVTSVEMRETPVLGLLTEMGGCLFVERRSREKLHEEIKEIESALAQGFNVVVFPEATSHDGSEVKPFKKALLAACEKSEANIMPFVINYLKVNGQDMSHRFRDWVFWYGDIGFAESIWRASQIFSAEVELKFFSEILVNENSNRREIAEKAHGLISSEFIKIPYPNGNNQSDKKTF